MDANKQGKGLGPDIDDLELEHDYEVVFRHAVPAQVVDSAAPSVQKQISAVQQWLQPTDYLSPGNEFMKHLHAHVPGTGSWLRESPAFQAWTAPGKPNCLAVRGVAGSGKSVLAASAIRQLQEAEPDVPVLFFFFRQIVEKNHSARYLIRDFASQLLPYSQSLISRLDVLRESSRVEGNEHGLLLDALLDSVHGLEKVYVVVDALDEMDDQDFPIIDRLAQLGNSEGSRVKVLFTSRPMPRIEETMRVLQVPHVRLDPTSTYPDVAKYVAVSISSLDAMLSPETEDKVKQAICERARGLFLHARLMTDTLAEGLQTGRITEETLPDSLDRLPHNLIDVYEEMLKEHSRRSGVDTEQQACILRCVTHASRPLRLIELGSLVARMIGSGDLREGKALVRASCGRLLEILDDETVSIIHHSFTEFLHDKTRASRAGSFPVLDEVTAHVMLTVLSLQYLDQCLLLDTRRNASGRTPQYDHRWAYNDSERRKQMFQDLPLDYPLLHYAILNLSHHVSKAGDGHPDVVSALDAFFVPGKSAFTAWAYGNWGSYQGNMLNAVHIASLENWPAYVEHLCTNHPSLIDAPGPHGRSPLSYAAERGHSQIVRYLLRQGATPDSDSESCLTPMQYAACRGHVDVAKLLLDAGISPLSQKAKGTPSRRCRTALQCAFESGHSTILDIFLPLVPTSQADRCLHWAANADHIEKVLKTGNANVNSYYRGRTRLFQAAESCDLEAIQVLLRYGADPNRRCGMNLRHEDDNIITQPLDYPGGPTPIHAFAGYFKLPSIFGDKDINRARQCLETLVSYGAQVNARANNVHDYKWRTSIANQEGDLTALHYAVRKQDDDYGFGSWFYQETHEVLVKLLLGVGADPNARSRLGRNCIHFANPEQPGLIDILVAGGADVNATDVTGQSPLLTLLSPKALSDVPKPNVEVFTKLIQNGANISLCSNDGNTALHMVFMSLSKFKAYNIPFLLSLVSSSEDFSRTNNLGLIPLFAYKVPKHEFPRREDGEKILEAMVQNGMDINACDTQGETILWKVIASNNASLDIFHQFIRLGANPTLRKRDGSTLLHHAARNKVDVSWLSHLVMSGVDPTLQDDEGRTPIHLAVRAFGNEPDNGMQFINSLVKLGVPPTKSTMNGQTVLHLASWLNTARGRENWIDCILREPIFGLSDPNVTNLYGVTPLHHAAHTSEFTVGKLLQAGANPECLTTEGLSPLHIACIASKPNVVGLLLSCYKERNVLDQFVNQSTHNETRSSPLHYACRSRCLESIRYLLSHTADPCRRDANDRTPLHALAEGQLEWKSWKPTVPVKEDGLSTFDNMWMFYEHHRPKPFLEDRTADILSLLIGAGADQESRATNEDGSSVTAMDLALVHDSPILVRELLRLGVTTAHHTRIELPDEGDMAKPKAAQSLQALPQGSASDSLTHLSQNNSFHTEAQNETKKNVNLYNMLATACTSEVPNLHVIKTLIETNGLDVNRMSTPIHSLALGNHFWQIEALRYVLSLVTDATLLNAPGKTYLLYTISSTPPRGFWKEATIRILLENGCDPNENELRRDGSRRSCLEMSDDARITQLLLEHGADLCQSPRALEHAITERMDPSMVRHLLRIGANANSRSKDGKYPLHSVAPKETDNDDLTARKYAIMEALLEYGADPFKLYDDGRHVLQACIEEHRITCPLLEVEELNLECKGKDGRTALISACVPSLPLHGWRTPAQNCTPHPQTALALLERGAVVDALDDTGRSALHWLCTFEDEPFGVVHADLLAKLVAVKPSLIHIADRAGYKPLHLALQSNQMVAMQYLIEKGADPSEPDPNGNTALHHCARLIIGRKPAAAEAALFFKGLLERGLEINARNHRGETPLHIFMATGWKSQDKWKDEVRWEGQLYIKSECGPEDLVGHDSGEIWDMFNSLNADWKTRDNEGSGLLHVIAARKIECTGSTWERNQRGDREKTFMKLMQEIGLDPRLEDAQLRTPIDIAVGRENRVALLQETKVIVSLRENGYAPSLTGIAGTQLVSNTGPPFGMNSASGRFKDDCSPN
ncbi:ankyrin repeat-containing domain protein [Hypoxylon argillaceum]|nr:ankyrin repeat-containing domain protein [Hypoxylon argillaceum]